MFGLLWNEALWNDPNAMAGGVPVIWTPTDLRRLLRVSTENDRLIAISVDDRNLRIEAEPRLLEVEEE